MHGPCIANQLGCLVPRHMHRIRPALASPAAVTHICVQQGAGCQDEGRKYYICSSRLRLIRRIRPASPACQSNRNSTDVHLWAYTRLTMRSHTEGNVGNCCIAQAPLANSAAHLSATHTLQIWAVTCGICPRQRAGHIADTSAGQEGCRPVRRLRTTGRLWTPSRKRMHEH